MIIEKVTSREGYQGVMMTDYNNSGIPLLLFLFGAKKMASVTMLL